MATDKYIDPALVPRRNSQLGATMQMGIPPPAAKLAIAPRALPQNNPQLAATSGVAGVVPPAAAKLSVAPRRFSSGLPGVQGPAMPMGTPVPRQMPAGIIAAPLAQAPALAATPVTPPAPVQAPLNASAQGAAGVPALSRPTQTMTDKQIWDTRAKGRMVNGVQTFDSEWAKDPNNARRLELYAGNGNAVASVVPAPGVAASTVTGGNMPEGVLTRAPQGFTAADRATQLDNMDRQGQQYATRSLNERAVQAAKYGNADAGALQEAAKVSALAQPPRIQPLQRQDPNDAARLSMEQQRLGMDQQQAGLVAEQTKLGTQSQQLQLKQAQQMQALSEQLMQALSEQLMSGTPEQKQAAAASLAALQNTKPGDPVKVKRKMPTGQVDALGQPVMGEEEVLYNPQTGQWMAPPAAGGAGGKQLPAGVTPQNAIADAQAAIAAGASRDAIAAELAQYGISL